MRVRALVVATGVVLAMSGCSHGAGRRGATPSLRAPGSTDATGSEGSTTIPSGVTDTPASATAAPTTAATSASPGGGAHCTTASLTVTLTELGAAAGTAFREVVFKNTSGKTCIMDGYPAVTFVDTKRRQIGPPAQPMEGAGGRVTVAPGGLAAALIAYHDVYVTSAPDCQPATAAAIRVYPPMESVPLLLPASLLVCANQAAKGTASVSPVAAMANVHP